MKGKKLQGLLLSFFILIIFFLPISLFAQGPGGPGGGGDPACDPKCNCRPDGSICPIDSYLYLLLAIGILYGIKKIMDARKATLK